MPLMTHEACELNELLMSCTNSINSMGLFMNEATDPKLKSILQKHMAAHVQDYNMKVEWATKGMSTQKLAVPAMPQKSGGTHKLPQAVVPNPQTTALNDRAIATSYLLTLKRSGRDYAWATFECSDPALRCFLEDAFTMCSRHSFEVAEYMTQQGWYPSDPVPTTLLQKVQQSYDPVREMATVQ